MQTLEKTLAGGGTAGHNVPELVLEFVEFEGLGDLLWVHGYIGGEEEEELIIDFIWGLDGFFTDLP